MSGNAEDPARIGPFKKIIEVHWGKVTHVAFSIVMAVTADDNTTNSPPPDPGPSGRLHVTLDDFHNVYVLFGWTDGTFNHDYDYLVTTQPTNWQILRGETWSGPSLDDVEIPGGLPPFSGGGVLGPFQSGGPDNILWALTPDGSSSDIKVPGNPLVTFDWDTHPLFRYRHTIVATDGPVWIDTTDLSVNYAAPAAPGIDDLFSDSYPAPELVTYKNKAFRLCATAGIPSSIVTLWLLYARSPDDDPTA